MFQKVQLKFFVMTTGILLAIFLAVLISINLIMEAVMQRQSKIVLQQIASSIEYDEITSSFKYYQMHDDENKPMEDPEHRTGASSQPDNNQSENSGDTSSEQTTESITQSQNEKENDTETHENSNVPEKESSETTDSESIDALEAKPTDEIPSEQTQSPEAPDNPTDVQPAPDTSEPAPDNPQPPFQGEDPQYPHNWENPPPWQKEPDENKWNGDYYNLPLPDERFDFYQGEPVPYSQEYVNIEQESCTFSDANFCLQNIAFRSAQNEPILKDYTVMSSSRRIIQNTDTDFEKRHEAPVPKSLGSIDFFVLMADNNGNFLNSLNNDDLDESVAQKYINAILKDGASSGMLNSFQFCQIKKYNGTLMVFTDKSAELDMLTQLNYTTILIGIISFILLSLLTFFFSKKSIEPIKVAFEKQKQFVSDASHELKTPLTIISANADVLADEIGENKWLTYIKSQTERMNVLVNDLLNLTRIENNTTDFIFGDFNLSTAIENTALPFECHAFETQKTFEIDIEENLTLSGSEFHIKQMAAIFIDNALKYSNDKGTVRITLKSQGDKRILSIFNTGSGIRNDEKNKIFERFYRSDNSRARATGGYGLGLAIAKSIIDKHKFKLTIDNIEGESICFNIIM